MDNKSFIGFAVLLAFFVTPALASSAPSARLLGLSSIEKMRPNGEYVVYVQKDSAWIEAGQLEFDRFFRERTIDLSKKYKVQSSKFRSEKDNTVRILLEQKGGGAAHIDSVFLGDAAPVEVKDVENGLRKLSKKDYDVIDAFGKTIEIVFPAKDAGPILHLTARVEAKEISKVPFQFPLENLYREMNAGSRFYSYRLQSSIQNPKSEIFFKEFSQTGSGHPSGFTYGWVWNDAENLYVKIDFTPDNTMDGDKDYAKVYVKTEKGLKEFKVSVPEQKWGKPLFTYTDTVSYQHKVYDFSIPLKEDGISDKNDKKEMQLAFAAYGTAYPAGHY